MIFYICILAADTTRSHTAVQTGPKTEPLQAAASQNGVTVTYSCPQMRHILTSFRTSFVARFSRTISNRSLLETLPHSERVATLPCEVSDTFFDSKLRTVRFRATR